MKTFKINSEKYKETVFLSSAIVSVSSIGDDSQGNKYTEIEMANGKVIRVNESPEDVLQKLHNDQSDIEFTGYQYKFEFSIS